MSVSCIGTCSECGAKRFWLSDTLALQLDDGSLKCLPHPAEEGACEQEGLTLDQASERGRLYRETFYVCDHCGRGGEIIEQVKYRGVVLFPQTAWGDVKLAVGLAVVITPILVWLRWWPAVAAISATLGVYPLMEWWKRRKAAASDPRRAFPKPDAPGRIAVAPPTRGCVPEVIVGHVVVDAERGAPSASGACCDRPDWHWAGGQRDEDKIPCYASGRGVMTVSERSIH